MKYLLPCTACGQKTPVATGQAGQTIHCACGSALDIPSIRALRQLEPVAEAPAAPLWNKQKGLLFVGSAIALCSVAFCGAILFFRPSLGNFSMNVSVDKEAVDREVDSLPLADGYARFSLATAAGSSGYADRLQKKELPPYLQLSATPIIDFEHSGSKPLAGNEFSKVAEATAKARQQIVTARQVRESLGGWLIAGGVGAILGVLIVGLAIVIKPIKRAPQQRRKPQGAKSR